MKIEIKSIFGEIKISGDFSSLAEAALKNKANLCGADLSWADLSWANLRGADLCGADLRGADLCGANLREANLRGANLCEANLCGANLFGANLREADLRKANLCGANLFGADLRKANLCEANLFGADLNGANLCGANLRKANLFGKEKIEDARIISGLYPYLVAAILTADGTRHIKMGCLQKTLEEWDKIGIYESNLSEFPNDKSFSSEERAAAFQYAKTICLLLK